MSVDPLLPMIMAHRPLAMNNRLRAQIVADTPIDARDLAGTRERLCAAILEQIVFAQAEALTRSDWPDESAPQIGANARMIEQK